MKAGHDAQAPKPKRVDRNWKKRSFYSKEEINQIVKIAQEAQAKAQAKASNESDVEELNNFEMLKIRTNKEDSSDEYTSFEVQDSFKILGGENIIDVINLMYWGV